MLQAIAGGVGPGEWLVGCDDLGVAGVGVVGAVRIAATVFLVISAPLATSALTCSGWSSCSLLSSCSVRGEVQRPDLNAWSSAGGRWSSAR